MKTFQQQNYPCTIKVRVSFTIDCFYDEIKGLNPGHALYLAKKCWPTAEEIAIIQPEEH